MIEAYDVETVRAAEERAIAALAAGGDDGGDVLMQRAAKALAQVAAARLRERRHRTVVALVGGGNNGGDALFALARLARHGFDGTVVQLADTAHPAGLAAARDSGAHVVPAGSPSAATALQEADLVLDGITGIGGRAGLTEPARAVVEQIGDRSYVIAVDLPSGADPAGRTPLGAAVLADETVTFGVCKPVHLLPATAPAVGRLTVVDIGLDLGDPGRPERPVVARMTRDDVAGLWPVPGPADHKYTRGVVGMLAGSPAYPGAGVLATLGALAAGPGMVRYLGDAQVAALVHQVAPEAVRALGQVQSWVVGPGLDPDDDTPAAAATWQRVDEALAGDLPVVVDAGALDRVTRRAAPTVLTPHAGEAARLLTRLAGAPVTRGQVEADPVGSARRLAELTDATVLLKGATTLVAPAPGADDPLWVVRDAPAWTGTAGAGDVLAGIIGTLLAAGLSPARAGALAALVHGVAADEANPGGPVRPPRIADALPGAVARLLHR